MPQTQTAAERVKLNRQLAQMLKGGVIMDVTSPSKHISPRRRAPAPSWPSSASQQTSAPPAA